MPEISEEARQDLGEHLDGMAIFLWQQVEAMRADYMAAWDRILGPPGDGSSITGFVDAISPAGETS